MSRWGDDIDEELQRESEIEVGFTLNFKSMSLMIDRIVEETREWDAKYPKSELLMILMNDLLILLVLVVFSYNVLMIATVPFLLFYGYILIQLGKAWKRFQYSKAQYRLLVIGGLIVVIVIGVIIQGLIFH